MSAVGTIFVFAHLSNMLARLVVFLRRPDRQIPVNSVMSAAKLADDLAGCVDGGPVDLSTNPDYMEEFGS